MKIISDWKFETSSTGAVGYALFSISGGMVRLNKFNDDGKITDTTNLSYRGAGVGASLGLKLPQGMFAPTDFTSAGIVFKLPSCKHEDLEIEDFLGPCAYVDVSAGVIAGAGGTMLFIGLPKVSILPIPFQLAQAKACIPMAGYTLCMQAHLGITGSVGVMYQSGAFPSIPFA